MTQATITAAEIRRCGGLEKFLRTGAAAPGTSADMPENGAEAVHNFTKTNTPNGPCRSKTASQHQNTGVPVPEGRARPPRNGRTYATEAMNRTEARYTAHLNGLIHAGRVVAWAYESIKFKLADRTFYTPDFFVIMADGGIEIHEVKGHWEDDARVKIKAAARMNPWFRFRAVKAARGGRWAYESFGGEK